MDENLTSTQPSVLPPTPPATPPIQTPKDKKSLLLMIVIHLIAVAVLGYFVYQNMQLKKQIAQPQPAPTAFITSTALPTTDPTANWKTYQISQLKMSLKMPPQVNPSEELNFTTSQGNYYWNDAPSSLTKLYATSTKSTFEGGFSYLYGCVGYKKSEVGYKFLTYTNAEIDMSSKLTEEMVNQNQVKYLVVKSDPNQIIEGMPPLGIVENGYIAAIINTNNAEYPALVIQMKLSDNNTESIFNQVLSTFKLTQ